MKLGGVGVGVDDDVEGGVVEGEVRGFHLVEESSNGIEGMGRAQLAEELVEDGGVRGEVGLGRGPLEEAECGGVVGLAAEEVEELGGGKIGRERVVGCGSGSGGGKFEGVRVRE